jgi:hypothetical protein
MGEMPGRGEWESRDTVLAREVCDVTEGEDWREFSWLGPRDLVAPGERGRGTKPVSWSSTGFEVSAASLYQLYSTEMII